MEQNNKLSIKGLISNYAGLPKSIYILFVARIINRFGGFVHGFLALFLGMYLGMDEAEIGTYVLMAGLAGFAGTLVGGKLGDHYSRKKIYLSAQAMAAVLFLPCAYFAVHDVAYIPGLLIASSFFSSIVRPVSTAMVTDLVDKEDRKRAFSLLYLGINFGVALGPLVAAFLLENYLVWFFLGDAITTFIAVILVGLYVQEKVITEDEMNALSDQDSERKEKSNLFVAFLKRPILIVFVVFAVINAMIYAQIGFAMPILMRETFEDGVKFYGLMMSFNAMVVIFLTSLIHYLTQKIKPIYNIAMASLLYAVGLGMMALISTKGMFVISIFIWTVGEIQAVTNQNVYLMHHTPINFRSRFLGIISVITSLGYVLSPKLSGNLIVANGANGQPLLWKSVFVAGLISGLGFIAIGLYEKRKAKLSKNI